MLIYPPVGSARSDAALAVNVYSGCSHGCLYCYAPAATFVKRDKFFTVCDARKGSFLQELRCEAMQRMRKRQGGHVLLSFTSDPYQEIDLEFNHTRRVLEILHSSGHSFVTLTKGGRRSLRNLDLYIPGIDEFGTTMTVTTEELRQWWEPGSDTFEGRCEALKEFNSAGIYTWISLEPVLYVDEVKRIIETTREYVDHYRIGRLNRHQHAKTIDWYKFAAGVTRQCLDNDIPYFIKKELLPFLPAGVPDTYKCQRP